MDCRLEEMVKEHAGLVKSIAFKLSKVYGEDAEDLIQIGYIGLIKAIKGFDETKGYKFSTYAVPLITGEIRSTLRDQGRIKVSRSIKSDAAQIKSAETKFMIEKGRSPHISELAAALGLTEERVKQALQALDALQNMESYEESGLMTREEDKNIIRMDLKNSLTKLGEQERQVMCLRYYKDMTQSQVAKVLQISQVQVSRIERKSLKTLKNFMTF